MKQKSLKFNAFLNVLRTLMSIIFPIITFPYASRILLPEGIGKVNYVNSIVSYFTMLAGLGIGTYAMRETAKLRDNQTELNKFYSEILCLNLISTLISYILFFIIIFIIPYFKDYRTMLIISSITIFFTTIGIGWFYAGIEEYTYITIRTIIFQIISIVLLYSLVKTKDDLLIYLIIGIISSVGSNLFYSRKFIKVSLAKPNFAKHLKPSLLLFSITVIASIYSMLDTTMLGSLSTNEQVGFYTAATKINKMVLTLVTSISAVIFPRLSYYANNELQEDFKKLVNKSFSFLLCISIPATVGLNLLCEPIMLLFSGKEFIPAIPVMKLMNPIIIIIALSNLIGTQIFIPLKKEKTTIRAVSIGASINFILNFILIKHLQAYGAAIASLTAECIVLLHQIICARQYFSFKDELKNFIQYIVATIIMCIPVLLFRYYIKNLYIQLMICIFSGAFFYYITLLLFKNSLVQSVTNQIINKFKRDKTK